MFSILLYPLQHWTIQFTKPFKHNKIIENIVPTNIETHRQRFYSLLRFLNMYSVCDPSYAYTMLQCWQYKYAIPNGIK